MVELQWRIDDLTKKVDGLECVIISMQKWIKANIGGRDETKN